MLAGLVDGGDALSALVQTDWQMLYRWSQREDLEGFLYRRCLETGIEVPGEEWRDLQEVYRRTAERNFVILCELDALLRELERMDLELLVLPGLSLLALYPDPGCRPMDDVDILYRTADRERVMEGLRALGFATPSRHDELFLRDELALDLHADLINCERIRSRRYAGWMDPEEVWGDGNPGAVEGVEMRRLGLEDAILYSAVHALRHGFRRLTWFVDLRALLQAGVDWGRLGDKAERYNLERPLLYVLRYMERWPGWDLPVGAVGWKGNREPGRRETWMLNRAFRRRGTEEWGDLLWFFSIVGSGHRALFLVETLFPRPAVLLQVFPFLPRSLFPLAYLLRVFQLLVRGVRQLSEIAWRS